MSTLEVTERIRSGWIRFRAGLLAEGAIIAIAAAALIVALRPYVPAAGAVAPALQSGLRS